MMTPKEKAIELVDKYVFYVESYSSDQQEDYAKQCALIAVDEIIYYLEIVLGVDNMDFEYWQEVKKKIELL